MAQRRTVALVHLATVLPDFSCERAVKHCRQSKMSEISKSTRDRNPGFDFELEHQVKHRHSV
jgi:hypothetical protein